MELRYSGHSAYKTEYHIIWIPKYRRKILNPGVRAYLNKLFPKVLRQMPGCQIISHNIQLDHIHLLMIIPPKYSVSSVVAKLKQFTSHHLRKKFVHIRNRVFWQESIVWSPGFFVATVGLNEQNILNYIRWRQQQDSGQAKLAL